VKEKMVKKFLFMILIISAFLLTIIPISYSITIERLKAKGVTAKNYHEIMKGIVIMPSDITPSEIPYDTEVWDTHYKKIIKTVGPEALVARNSPQFAYVIVHVPIEKYNKTVKLLRKKGFYVRDEIMGRLHLDESVPAMKGPYEWLDRDLVKHKLTGDGGIITILDSGINCSHPDFNDCASDNAGKLLYWHDIYDYLERPEDVFLGHGTHVASIAAGTGDASDGKYKGVAPGAGLKIVRVTSYAGDVAESKLADAIEWAIQNGTDVISMSLGYPEQSYLEACSGTLYGGPVHEIWYQIQRAINSGIVVVASAGNNGIRSGSIEFPACIDEVVAVGATFKKDYSNFEDLSWEDWNGAARIHYIVNISGGFNANYEGEWIADSNFGTGFDHSFFVTERTTVRVRIEGQWKDYCVIYNSGWDPGDTWKKDDEYWEQTRTFYGNSYITLEIGVRPVHYGGLCWETHWNKDDIDETIRVRIFDTFGYPSEGLLDQVVLWSSRGPAPQETNKPDVVAPGYSICAARISDSYGELICGNDDYISAGGTSMAAAHVAGLVALLKEADPDAGRNELVGSLEAADHIYPYDKHLQGQGRINVQKAVNRITNCVWKESYDNDADDDPFILGSCYDYTTWYGDSCSGVPYYDYCDGDYLYEYHIHGPECRLNPDPKNCQAYGSDVICYYGRCKYSTDGGGVGGGGSRHKK